MLDNSKVRFLYKRVHHPGLKISIEVLKTMQKTGTAVTYTMSVNHLYTEVSKLQEYLNKNRSILDISIGGDPGGGGQNNNSGGGSRIYNSDGSINTGYISDWRSLSKMDQ